MAIRNIFKRVNQCVKERFVISHLRRPWAEQLPAVSSGVSRQLLRSKFPDYLPSLHQLSTDITPTDELIAMLLLLELSNNEIALTLGVSKHTSMRIPKYAD